MTIPEAIEILINANKWRRGEEMPMPDPKVFGEAIDLAIGALLDKTRQEVVGSFKKLTFRSKI